MSKRLLIALLVAAWMSCCASNTGEEKDRLAVQHIVLRYAQLLAEGYAQMNMASLRAVATEEQALKAYRHMSALGDAKIRMEPHLKDIEFVDIQLPEKDLAKVKTKEEWNYAHVSMKTPQQRVVKGLIYNIDYALVKRDGRWLVSSVSILEENKGEDAVSETQQNTSGSHLNY